MAHLSCCYGNLKRVSERPHLECNKDFLWSSFYQTWKLNVAIRTLIRSLHDRLHLTQNLNYYLVPQGAFSGNRSVLFYHMFIVPLDWEFCVTRERTG
jgi:hypothetical protein